MFSMFAIHIWPWLMLVLLTGHTQRGLSPHNFAELAEAVPVHLTVFCSKVYSACHTVHLWSIIVPFQGHSSVFCLKSLSLWYH